MKSKITLTGIGIEDKNFRCFYQVTFDDKKERKNFVAQLQHQPKAWESQVAWVIDIENNRAEAYIETLNKDTLLKEIDAFLDNELPDKKNFLARCWGQIQRPYWWWQTRHLR